MEILSVTLKNFKSHSDRSFTFQPGTNAICGENGAGKTSILEAIAWTLFNYRGAYKLEDLIRNGMSNAQAIVEFVSKRDGRTYAVKRCTTSGYTIFDPQLSESLDYRRIDDEVMPWLRQHLGVAPGTDLGRLFANTVGVPQGTFTADFLQTPETRKKIFDSILKVEEYRQTNQQMLSLEKYAKAEVDGLEQTIAQYDEALAEWELLQQRQQSLKEEIAQAEATLSQLQAKLAQLQAEKDQLATQAKQVQHLAASIQQLTAKIEGKQQSIALLDQAVQRARQAVQTCKAQRISYQTYLQVQDALKQLDQQIKQRQTLLKQRDTHLRVLSDQQTELTRLNVRLDALSRASTEIEQLLPAIQQQESLEHRQATIVEHLNQLQGYKSEQQNLSRQFAKLQSHQASLKQEIERIQALQADVALIPELEQKRDRLQEQLSRVDAAKQFEAELRQLVTNGEEKRDRHQVDADTALATLREMQQFVPLLATDSVESALAAIQAGVDLNTDLLNTLWRILADLSEQVSVSKLQQQIRQVKTQLETVYHQRAEFGTLEAKQTQFTHFNEELVQLQVHITELKDLLSAETNWQQQRQQVMAELKQLGDPRGRTKLLQQELQQHSALSTQRSALNTQYTATQSTIAALDAQLEQFAELDEQIEYQKDLLQSQQAGYLTYLQHQNNANQLPQLESDLQMAIDQLNQLQHDRQELQETYDQLSQTFDPQKLQQIDSAYTEARSQADQIQGGLPQQRKLLDELDHRLTRLQKTAEQCDRAKQDLIHKKKVQKFITFARKAYKEAGPRITERYVQTISQEADRLFRELLNRPNVALEWTRDYEILVQEGSHNRRLLNLSGGEQMCAALAVRLALLRVLSDIDIAFFDEPTTNMDKPRRESLAEAISNIKTFRQLFVISHDDTFEKVTENIIVVEREI